MEATAVRSIGDLLSMTDLAFGDIVALWDDSSYFVVSRSVACPEFAGWNCWQITPGLVSGFGATSIHAVNLVIGDIYPRSATIKH